ncbi:DoxX-like family protein [Streptacidiphilus jiangxiensis]|uniref:DoxX-like family protein n=1 Tax=Streptacidiphilus jiangxiensis TaxID=235985 RepID=A0A1H7WZA1_STRJI|nr:DoxX-like family protein [Streptacidiphilus jiangxiensis]SEM26900.1 DoxX-like family protein [Streptacidiphilus jiangxiensis]
MQRSRRTALPAAAVALTWFYEGLWCKLWPGRADQRAIVGSVPMLPAGAVTTVLAAIGLMEVGIGLWVLSGRRPLLAAAVQTALIVAFNTGGLLFGADQIAEPGRLVVQDLALIALIWTVATTRSGATAAPARALAP